MRNECLDCVNLALCFPFASSQIQLLHLTNNYKMFNISEGTFSGSKVFPSTAIIATLGALVLLPYVFQALSER